MKTSDLLLEPDLDFFRFPKHKTGWGVRYTKLLNWIFLNFIIVKMGGGQDTLARVSSPPLSLPD